MTLKTFSIAPFGLQALLVTVEVSIITAMPSFQIVGLPDKAVNEAKERVRAALLSCGITLPAKKILVNLAPADIPKEGGRYDLPIAIALLAALGAIPEHKVNNLVSVGELRLDGSIESGHGLLPAALTAHDNKYQFLCSTDSLYELKDVIITPPIIADNLITVIQILNDKLASKFITDFNNNTQSINSKPIRKVFDMRDVRGQETAKHALEIAASGGHNVLLSGPPGAGKSMLASCFPDILPPPTADEMFDIALIASVSGDYHNTDLTKRPFRSPHHSASMAALIGGGRKAQPGDITLAHCGVLFLDELPEFKTDVLDSLRQPLETGDVVISRAERRITYPARFQLIAAMNPCKCGYLGDETRECHKAPHCGVHYTSRISGPLLDRFDIRLHLSPVSLHELTLPAMGETSATVQNRVIQTKNVQLARYEKFKSLSGGTIANATIKGEFFDTVCKPTDDAKNLLAKAVDKFNLSARGYHRILRTARTLQDMQDTQEFSLNDTYNLTSPININNIATAVNFRH
jgi:magnesium chelatase family protein